MKNGISKGEGERGERGEAEGRKACSMERVVEEKTVGDLLQGNKEEKKLMIRNTEENK